MMTLVLTFCTWQHSFVDSYFTFTYTKLGEKEWRTMIGENQSIGQQLHPVGQKWQISTSGFTV